MRGMFYVIFAIFGGLSGYSLAQQTYPLMAETLLPWMLYANFGATILFGVLVGVTIAPLLANVMVGLVDRIAVSLQTLPIQEVLMGSIGLLFGLIIAFFVNLALQQINFSAISIIGIYLGPLLISISTLFLGTLGAYFGSRVVFIHSLRELLETGSSGRGGRRLVLLDTSAIVDGRIVDVRETGFLDGLLVVPRFVLDELQLLADSEDPLKRNRGRRGLDILNELRKAQGIQINDKNFDERGVDAKLIRLAQELRAFLCTTDFNLAKVAAVQGLSVLNINQLTSALKPVVLPGEHLVVKVLREGKESGQGVGYVEDGTMVVIEEGRRHIGDAVVAEITSVVQTAAGRMFFARYRGRPGRQEPVSGEQPAAEPRPEGNGGPAPVRHHRSSEGRAEGRGGRRSQEDRGVGSP